MKRAPIEQRVSRLIAHSARIVDELRREGAHDGAERFDAVTREVIANMLAEDERERARGNVIDLMDAIKRRARERMYGGAS